MSYVFVMLIHINKISWNVPLDGKPSLRTSVLISQGDIHPRPTLLSLYDQN